MLLSHGPTEAPLREDLGRLIYAVTWTELLFLGCVLRMSCACHTSPKHAGFRDSP